MNISANYIPKLSNGISFTPFDKKSYLVCLDNEDQSKLNISLYTKLLLEQIDGAKSIAELTNEFNKIHNTDFTIDSITKIFESQVVGYGILDGDSPEKIIGKDNYLKIRVTLISEKYVPIIAHNLTFLFGIKRFIIIFLFSLGLLIYLLFSQTSLESIYNKITPSIIFYFYIFNILSLFAHEFGHAAACEKFGAKSGAIGFGFYLFTPVFYADVTDAWRLNRFERLIVDLAGIYIQIIFCLCLVGIYIITNNEMYIIIPFLIATTITINFNPFLRFDGYWALSDLLNIPNLKSKSNKIVFDIFKSIRDRNVKIKYSMPNIFLIVYGLISLMFVIFFVSYMVFIRNNAIIYFPLNLYNFFETILINLSDIEFVWVKKKLGEFILPLLFYYLVIKYIRKRLTRLTEFLKLKLWN